ncbi:hypothetical protein Poly30_30230 [Planctomycetes bacterium Poly30]|uniref:Uncharacterized protein n=1 Tax=Saltatorellus ferox TaxID=2528018 RepID=A0A518ETS6_9BACT|nr:hypothetical protein Poly30_30230 [Planctomycetes bacterium Poly30]
MTETTQEDRNRSAHEALDAARESATLAAAEFVDAVRAVLEDDHWPSQIGSAIDLERVVTLSHKGAWQIYRMGHAVEPLAELSNMPGSTTLGQFRRGAERHGVEEAALKRLTESHAALDRRMKAIGGDRETFIEMVAEWRGMPASGAAAAHCRQAFRANRHVWGISAKASFATLWFVDSGARIEAIRLRGMHGLTAARRTVWDVYGSQDPDRHTSFALADNPLEIHPLLPAYCRGVLPRLERRRSGGWTHVRAHFEAAGQIAQHSLVFGERVVRDDEPDEQDWFNLACSFPAEYLQVDVIAPIRWEPRMVQGGLYSVQAAERLDPGPQKIHSAATEAFEQLPLRAACRSNAMADYPAMIASIAQGEQLDVASYTLFRLTCEYPPTGSGLRLDFRRNVDSRDDRP